MRQSRQHGFTLVELVIVVGIVGILASVAMPLARWSAKRSKEYELQQNLRILRNAIDRYHDAALAGLIEVEEGSSGYPPSLDVLVEGIPLIAEMPVPVPAVQGEYDASGAGLTGGLNGMMEQAQAGGMGGGPGLPGVGGAVGPQGPGQAGASSGLGQLGSRPGGLGSSGGSLFSGQSGAGAGAAQGSGFGSRGSTSPGLQTGGLGSASQAGQGGLQGQAGQQGGASGFGQRQSLLDRGTRLLGGGDSNVQQPIVGPDGQAIQLILLRRIPIDPFTGKAEWGFRCYGEPPDDRMWCGKDVLDVYSKSPAKAIDGTSYRDW